jgi:glycosyltransferase involved in cell wall biosynthesis
MVCTDEKGVRHLKILNVNHLLCAHTGGGAAERTFQMSRALVEKGLNCQILTLNIGLDKRRRDQLNGIDILAFPCINQRFFIPLVSYRRLMKAVEDADIIHLMGHWTLLNAFVYKAAMHLGKPYVVCPAGALPIYGRSNAFKRVYNALVGRGIVCDAKAGIAISPDEFDHFRDYGLDEGKVTLIRNGINQNDFRSKHSDKFRTRLSIPNEPYILFMGRLNSIKGPDLLLEAFCRIAGRISPYNLVFAGPDGGMLVDLKRLAQKYSCQNRVHFIGYVEGDDKAHAYAEAGLLAIPSRQEAMSIVVLEAGASATPVLITDQCGFDEVDSIGGGRVVSATVDGLVHGLLELLSNRKRLDRMGKNLNRYTLENFTWNTLVVKLLALYRDILNRNFFKTNNPLKSTDAVR